MKKQLSIGLILSMIFLNSITFAQTKEIVSVSKPENVTETHLDFVLNMISTSLNYGKSNSAVSNYNKPVFGGLVGVSFQAGITSKFSVVPELYLVMKGGKLEANNPLTVNKTTLRLYTIESPLLARFHFGKFYANAGPSIAYNVYGTRKTNGSSTENIYKNSGEEFKRWDAGVQIGAGYRFKIKQKNVAFDVRYSYGLTNISNGKQEMYNRYLNVSLHFFNLWKTNPFAKK